MHRVDSFDEVRDCITLHRMNLQNQFHVQKIGIFGSAARDELDENSDIDILVEFDRSVGFFHLSHLQEELMSILGRNVDLTTSGAIHPFLRNSIMQDLIYV